MTETRASTEKISPRRWTLDEDTLLVNLLLSLDADGKWKAEGGFKSGYLVHLEKLIFDKMPEAGLKATNIDSRLSYLKKRFNALLEIKHKGSGFGWDDGLKMITGDRKLFDEWCTSHKDAKGLYRKPFPLFDAMEEIYSKDRATGVNSNMPLDRVDQEINNEISNAETQNDVEVPNEESGSSKRTLDETSNQPTKKKARKNKEIQNMQKSFEKFMGTMLENSNSQIAQLTAMLEGPKISRRACVKN